MRFITRKVPANFNLFLFGDKHAGSVLSHEDGFKQLTDMIHSPYAGLPASANYAWDHGDMIEAIMVDDPRFRFQIHKQPFPLFQIKEAVAQRWSIRKKLVGCNIGNHEWKLLNFGDIAEEICSQLGVPYGTWSTRITYRYKKDDSIIFKHFATHGTKIIRSIAKSPELREANMKDQLRESLKRKSGDCALASAGHSHVLLVAKPKSELQVSDDEHKIHQIYTNIDFDRDSPVIPHYARWYASTGSFLKMYGDNGLVGYAERFGFDPVELGFCVALVRDRKIVNVQKIVL